MAVVAVLHHLERPFLGQVEGPLRAAGLTLDERHVLRGDALPDLGAIDAVVSLGGEMSVRDIDRHPALGAEAAFLRSAFDQGLPVLGVCLGGQLLAHALGARVRLAGRVLEWRDLEPTEAALDDPIFSRLPTPVPALHFNEDVFDLPAGAVELLTGEGEGVEAFRAGERAWAVQYHPDVDGLALDGWYADFGSWIDAIGVDLGRMRAATDERMRAQNEASAALFGAFADVVAGVPAR